MKCPICGAINDDDARFCENCGAKLTSVQSGASSFTAPATNNYSVPGGNQSSGYTPRVNIPGAGNSGTRNYSSCISGASRGNSGANTGYSQQNQTGFTTNGTYGTNTGYSQSNQSGFAPNRNSGTGYQVPYTPSNYTNTSTRPSSGRGSRKNLVITILSVLAAFIALLVAEYFLTGGSLLFGGIGGGGNYKRKAENCVAYFLDGNLEKAANLSKGISQSSLSECGFSDSEEYAEYLKSAYDYLYYEYCENISYEMTSDYQSTDTFRQLEFTVHCEYNSKPYEDILVVNLYKQGGKWYPVLYSYR
ncbi:MAG: zinc ribbon domain-containing protein [Eubacteriales bacterium]|nr:zinc ribbon domain-containing protein [Eubacteriales bacterium]